MVAVDSTATTIYATAHLGIVLSNKLYRLATTSATTTGRPTTNVNLIANSIVLIATALKRLVALLQSTYDIQNAEAVETAEQIAIDFQSAIEEIGGQALAASASQHGSDGQGGQDNGNSTDNKCLDVVAKLDGHFSCRTTKILLAQLDFIRATMAVFSETLALALLCASQQQNRAAVVGVTRASTELEEQGRLHVETLLVARQLSLNAIKHLEATDNESKHFSNKLAPQDGFTTLGLVPHHDGLLSGLLTARQTDTSDPLYSTASYVDQLLVRWTQSPRPVSSEAMAGQRDPLRLRRYSSPVDTNTSLSGDLQVVQFGEPKDMESSSPLNSPTLGVRRVGHGQRVYTLPNSTATNEELPTLVRAKSGPESHDNHSQFFMHPSLSFPPPPPPLYSPITRLGYNGQGLFDQNASGTPGSEAQSRSVALHRQGRERPSRRQASLPIKYHQPYATAVSDSETESTTSSSTRSSSSAFGSRHTRRKHRSSSHDLGIPWRLVLHSNPVGGQSSVWDLRDRDIVGPPERFALGGLLLQERMRQAYTPGAAAHTDISADWVQEEALKQAAVKYEQVAGKDGRRWGWRIRRALRFSEVEALVEHTIAMVESAQNKQQRFDIGTASGTAHPNSQPDPAMPQHQRSVPKATFSNPGPPQTQRQGHQLQQQGAFNSSRLNPSPNPVRSVSFSDAPASFYAELAQPPNGLKRALHHQPQSHGFGISKGSTRQGSGDHVFTGDQEYGQHSSWSTPRSAGPHAPLQQSYGQHWKPAAPPIRSSMALERDSDRDAVGTRELPHERNRRTEDRERERDRELDRERDRSRDRSRDREDRRRERKLRALETSVKGWEREKVRKKKTGSAAAAIGRIGGLFAMMEELGSVNI